MSTIRYFDNIPHIVRYGMQDSELHRGWIIFWRTGTKFKITVDRHDIFGTPFEGQWMVLNEEPKPGDGKWVERWDKLCDLILSQAMPLLVELSPAKEEYWVTLEDYLHTPGYILKMVTDVELGDAVAEIAEPMKIDGAYELGPLEEGEVGHIPEDLTRYMSEDVIVLEKEQDWRRPPTVVKLSGGEEVYTLLRMEKFSRWADTGKIFNESLDRIRAYLNLHEQCRGQPGGYPANIPRVVGVITDKGIPSSQEVEAISTDTTTMKEGSLIAGILVTSIPKSRTLFELVRDAKTELDLVTFIEAHKDDWKHQTLSIVHELHVRGLYCGGYADETWYFINQHVIRVAEQENEVWMNPLVKSVDSQVDTPEGWTKVEVSTIDPDGDFEKGKAMDLKAVEKVFEKWLPEELGKIERPQEQT